MTGLLNSMGWQGTESLYSEMSRSCLRSAGKVSQGAFSIGAGDRGALAVG